MPQGIPLRCTPECSSQFRFKPAKNVSSLIHLRIGFAREFSVTKIGNKMTARVRQETWALMMQNSEKTGK